MKFSDYINESDKNKSYADIDTSTENTDKNIEDTFNKYKNYSQNDLLNEFFKISEKQKNNGKLDADKAEKIKEILNPYLDDAQNIMLKNLLNMVINDN